MTKTTAPTITPAYVWIAASDWRANKDISDQASLYVAPWRFTVALDADDTASMLAAVPLIDNVTVRQQPYEEGAIVAMDGRYRGVPICVQIAQLPVSDAAVLVANLRSAADQTGGAS